MLFNGFWQTTNDVDANEQMNEKWSKQYALHLRCDHKQFVLFTSTVINILCAVEAENTKKQQRKHFNKMLTTRPI